MQKRAQGRSRFRLRHRDDTDHYPLSLARRCLAYRRRCRVRGWWKRQHEFGLIEKGRWLAIGNRQDLPSTTFASQDRAGKAEPGVQIGEMAGHRGWQRLTQSVGYAQFGGAWI